MKTAKIAVILLAAGAGERFGGMLPKQFATLGGVNLWRIAYQHLRDALPDAHIVLVGAVAHQHMWDLSRLDVGGLEGGFTWVEGGATRSESVQAGLAALAYDAPQFVLVHDAARPFVSANVVADLLSVLHDGGVAAIPAMPATDTIKRVANAQVLQTLERSELWQVQTPQAFDYATLIRLHHASDAATTDDAQLFEQAGIAVQVVQGCKRLFKVTDAEDLELAKYYYSLLHCPHASPASKALASATPPQGGSVTEHINAKIVSHETKGNLIVSHETISAMGYDVHRLVDLPDDAPQYIRLGGVDIAHNQRLSGHSDADVVLHAITDAVLGLCSAGDIGQHFPPSNAALAGLDSAIFLRHAMQILCARGGELLHVDATIICESPKIAPHREAMRVRIANILGVELRRISIKATTTEGLGFTGRGEGISTQATATAKFSNQAF